MKIKATQAEFEKWIACVPHDGDLIFLSKEKAYLLKNESFKFLTQEQVKQQGISIWSLNYRSWYGYALNRADYCIWLTKGILEGLNERVRNQLTEEQALLNVPTLINEVWITSSAWTQLSKEEKIYTMQLWATQNEIQEYDSIDFKDLPEIAQSELLRIGYDKILNRFANFSGPNCFAASAGALVKKNWQIIIEQWMHWPVLEQHLHEQGFEKSSITSPQAGDVLIFSRNEIPIHSGYYLGGGFYFEKPGQDFYEPYRVEAFRDWQSSWPESTLSVWRKKA